MDPHRSPEKGHRKLQTSQNNLQTNERTTTSVLLEKCKLKTPRFGAQNKKVETSKPLDDWQRQVEFISIQLKQLMTEADSPTITPQTTEQDIPQESFYELMRNVLDNYFTNPNEPPYPNMDVTPKIHHTSITHPCEIPHLSCNKPKQPLADDDLANIVQFDKQRNLTYLPISTSPTLKRKRHNYYMPLDFEKLTLDGLIDTGALTMKQ